MLERHEDRWLLPRHQTEYPARSMIAEVKLHGRREATFLVLVTIALIATAAVLAYGTTRFVDVTALIARLVPDVDMPLALHLPLGVLAAPLGVIAVLLVCELYGRRRAGALLWAALGGVVALLALARLADLVDGQAAIGPALPLALAASLLVGHVAGLVLFDALRRRLAGRHIVLRTLLVSIVVQPAAWAAFGAVVYAITGASTPAQLDAIASLALGSALYVIAALIVLAIPLAVVARVLALFLRVARFDDELEQRVTRPPALIVEDELPVVEVVAPRRRAVRASLQPFSSAEMRFFTEGDQLADPAPDA